MRLFAALALPFDVTETLGRHQQGVPRARWRPGEALHVTLAFFGEVGPRQAEDLAAELSRAGSPRLSLTLSGVGVFNVGDRPTHLWAGVETSAELHVLAGRCEAAGRRAGLAMPPRTYRPHVTLAYLKGSPPDRVAAWLQGHGLLKSPPFLADRFGLYSSWPGPDGNQYDLEREYLLG